MLSIRTQDKMALVPYDSTIIVYENCTNEVDILLQKYTKQPIDIEKTYEYSLVVGKVELGTYATKERALKVLDVIEGVVDLYEYQKSNEMEYVSKAVYQMPKE